MTDDPTVTLSDGVVHHTYATTNRGLEPVMGYYGLLDRAPMGRNEGDPPEFWSERTVPLWAQQRGWWQNYSDVLPVWFEFYVGLEAEIPNAGDFKRLEKLANLNTL